MTAGLRSTFSLFALILLLFSGAGASPPDTLWNQADSQGRKQGHWKKYYPTGELMYKGFFRDDKPVGKMQRFYDDGKLKAEMIFSGNGETSYATMYFRNGQAGAMGKYDGQKRDSIWCYYSYYTGTLSYRESYRMGKKDGPSIKYYADGPEAEVLYWKDGMKHGAWKQYYEDSTLRLSSVYEMDQLNGHYHVFNRNHELVLDGTYSKGKMDGDWKYHDNQGKLERILQYRDGECLNSDEYEQWAKEFMDNVEKDLGKFPEPEYENFFERSP